GGPGRADQQRAAPALGREGKDHGRQRCAPAQDRAIIDGAGRRKESMKQISVAVVGTGWCGGIRAETCAAHPLTKALHIAEIRPERLAEVAKATGAKSAVTDYRELLKTDDIEAVYISATPESTHYPIARDWLTA